MSKKFAVEKTKEEWKKELSPLSYHVLREHGTEPAFRNEYNSHKDNGVYCCAGCAEELFSSKAKYESGSGWPSFYEPIEAGSIGQTVDQRYGMERVEIYCTNCGGHIGHVFTDGPRPTGMRYCTNSAALKFQTRTPNV